MRSQFSSGSASTLSHLINVAILVRTTLREVGEPLEEMYGPHQFLDVAHDITKALLNIYEAGILHRDISYGNVLLAKGHDAARGNSAFILEFGQALRVDPESGKVIDSDVGRGRQVIGTLPFIAWEILRKNRFTCSPYRVGALACHDLESWFWVLLHCGITFPYTRQPPPMFVIDKATNLWSQHTKYQLSHPKYQHVKLAILHYTNWLQLDGQFTECQEFMQKFAETCFQMLDKSALSGEEARELLRSVLELASEHRAWVGTAPIAIPPKVPPPKGSGSRKEGAQEDMASDSGR